MVTKTIDEQIEAKRKEYEDGHTVAFLGQVSSGKTVMAALVKHTLARSWIPNTNGKWEAVSRSGQDEINEIIRKMKKGIFPSPTPSENHPKLIIDIVRMEGPPTKLELVLHDMSGENYADLLTSSSYSSVNDILADMFLKNADYLVFAKAYVIMIDCGQKDDWDTDIAKVGPMISRIKEIKQKIHNFSPYQKIQSPITIVFTKADLLSEEDKTKSAKELAKEYPELVSSLNINYNKKSVKFFKMSVSAKRETETETVERIEKIEKEMHKQRKKTQQSWNEQIKTDIEQKTLSAQQEAVAMGYQGEQADKFVNDAVQETETSYKEQFDREHPLPEIPEEDYRRKWRVDIPLDYTESEYTSFISWILDTNNEY